jgi:DNA gyrase subunit B
MAKKKREINGFAILSDVDSIRMRSGMFIGSNDTPIHLLQEITDNALDELLNNLASKVIIDIDYDSCEVTVEDNGRGMIQGLYKDEKNKSYDGREIVDLICSKLFSSEKFSSTTYHKSVGLHGVGLVVVNALSEYLSLKIYNGKTCSLYDFKNGVWDRKLETKIEDRPKGYKGTVVSFRPNSEFFEEMKYDTTILLSRLKMFKYFYQKSTIIFNGEDIKVESIADIHKSFDTKLPMIEIETDNYHLALAYNLEETQSHEYGYVNLLPTNLGTHMNYISSVLKDTWQEVKKTAGFVFDKDDCFIGCSVLFSCYLTSPTFDSQTKTRLTISKSVMRESVVGLDQKLLKLLLKTENFNSFTRPLLIRFSEYRKSLKKLKTMDYLKEAMTYGDISDDNGSVRVSRNITNTKLLDCTSTDREETELYIVEGDSAGGSIKQCRDITKHAILPLRGKPLNVANMDLKEIVKNVEFQSLINAMGCGVFPLEKVENIRYSKIILCADADVDGRSIEAILLGGFLKLFPGLVAGKKLYICEAPLFLQDGKYYWTNDEIDVNKKFQRFKGLGEMNSNEIFDSMINPENRKLLQVVISDEQDRNYALELVSNPLTRKTMLTEGGYLE